MLKPKPTNPLAHSGVLRCQVPEEFNKGVEAGAAELEAKKAATLTADAGATTEEEKKA